MNNLPVVIPAGLALASAAFGTQYALTGSTGASKNDILTCSLWSDAKLKLGGSFSGDQKTFGAGLQLGVDINLTDPFPMKIALNTVTKAYTTGSYSGTISPSFEIPIGYNISVSVGALVPFGSSASSPGAFIKFSKPL
jgi:hypothetical protein